MEVLEEEEGGKWKCVKIILLPLVEYEDYCFGQFKLFEYYNQEFVNANQKADYPIMVQFLYLANFEITNKVSREKMNGFEMERPEGIKGD